MNWEKAKELINGGCNVTSESNSYYTKRGNSIIRRVYDTDAGEFITEELTGDPEDDDGYVIDTRSEEDMVFDAYLSKIWRSQRR